MTKGLNAQQVLDNVNCVIARLESHRWLKLRTREVCNDLSIFDWWTERLSMAQLRAMRAFLNAAIDMGYDGYVCFKVGAKYCSSGMWAYKAESENGFSPKGACVYRSFYSTGNYWDAFDGREWLTGGGEDYDTIRSARQLKKALAS